MPRDEVYLLDMLLAARKIQDLSSDVVYEQFLGNEEKQLALMHLVQIIGEAGRLVSDEYRRLHCELPWKLIVGMRNRIVHEYFRVIPEVLWQTIIDDIPNLIRRLEPLVPPDSEDNR